MNSLVYDCMFSLVEARRTRKNCRWVGLSISLASAGFRARSDLGRSLCNYTSLRGIYSSLREYNKLRPYYTAKEPATNWINTIGLRPRESFTQWYQIQIESMVAGNPDPGGKPRALAYETPPQPPLRHTYSDCTLHIEPNIQCVYKDSCINAVTQVSQSRETMQHARMLIAD